MQKRGDVWISAVLYIALGMVIVGLLLAAGMPLVNNMRDRNTFQQTKKLLYALDDTIATVAQEGPGSQRSLSTVTITKGKLFLDPANNSMTWSMETNAKLFEPNIVLREGPFELFLQETPQVGKFITSIRRQFSSAQLTVSSQFGNELSGTYSMLIRHTGNYPNNLPEVSIGVA